MNVYNTNRMKNIMMEYFKHFIIYSQINHFLQSEIFIF